MKIATYNILKGGSRRVHWRRLIEDHSVDLLLVQESYMHDEHLPPLEFPTARNQTVWEKIEENRWGSAVFSRSGSVTPVSVAGFSGWVVGAEIASASWQSGYRDPLFAFSIHAPEIKGNYWKPVNKILDEIKRIAGDREIIIGGDFNLTVSNWTGLVPPVKKQDLAIQTRLSEEFGLLNCWQEANPSQPLHQTLRWTRNRTFPYHCDGLFVPKTWKDRLLSCSVLSGDEWTSLSDHNPVVASFA